MGELPNDRHAVADLVARIGRSAVAGEIAAQLRRSVPAYRRLSPELAETEVLDTCRYVLRLWTHWLAAGRLPSGPDLEHLRAAVRARAGEGVALPSLVHAYRAGGRVGWDVLRTHALPAERDVLIDSAGELMRFLDALTALIIEAYAGHARDAAGEQERLARELLERCCAAEPLRPSDHRAAERLGVALPDPAVPFEVAQPGARRSEHAALAARLRAALRAPVVSDGDRVVGMAAAEPAATCLPAGAEFVLAVGEATARGELAAAREEVRLLADRATALGLRGVVRVEDLLPELLLARSPRLARALRARFLEPLRPPQHADLRRTVEVLIACRLDRARTCAELHVHRNTLAYRLARVEALVGIDLGSPRDLATLWLALAADQGRGQPA